MVSLGNIKRPVKQLTVYGCGRCLAVAGRNGGDDGMPRLMLRSALALEMLLCGALVRADEGRTPDTLPPPRPLGPPVVIVPTPPVYRLYALHSAATSGSSMTSMPQGSGGGASSFRPTGTTTSTMARPT